MNLRARRKTTLADLMLVVALVAVSLVSLRTTLRVLPLGWFPKGRRTPLGFTERYLDFAISQGVPILVFSSLAVIAFSLMGVPRLPLRRLAHRPGFVLCFAAVVATALTTAVWTFYHASTSDPFAIALKNILVFTIPSSVGYAELGVWVSLALSRRFLPSRSVLDRLGYFLGALWAVLFALAQARFVLLL